MKRQTGSRARHVRADRRHSDVAPALIRAWRDHSPAIEASASCAFSSSWTMRGMRQERSLSGKRGYDLNRHIRLNAIYKSRACRE